MSERSCLHCRQLRFWRDERGVALALAMMALLVLSALMVAFAVLSQSEPVIGNNHSRGTQARALAESGLERALWALSHPGNPAGIPDPMPSSPLPGPTYDAYNGNAFTSIGTLGGVQITVTSGAVLNQRNILSVGWVPNTGVGASHRRVQATAMTFRDLNPPCALCIRGDAALTGTASVNAAADTSCGNKYAAYATGTPSVGGAATTTSPNSPVNLGSVATSTFDQVAKLNPTDLSTLKAMAMLNGTYWGPGSPAGWSGTITFDSSNKIPKNGVIFIDTTDGNPVTTTNLAQVTLSGHPFASWPSPFLGWIIANGNISISGNIGAINGMVYATNNVSMTGFGPGGISGIVIAAEALGNASFSAGNSNITYNCANAKGAGQIPLNWFVLPGSYQESSG